MDKKRYFVFDQLLFLWRPKLVIIAFVQNKNKKTPRNDIICRLNPHFAQLFWDLITNPPILFIDRWTRYLLTLYILAPLNISGTARHLSRMTKYGEWEVDMCTNIHIIIHRRIFYDIAQKYARRRTKPTSSFRLWRIMSPSKYRSEYIWSDHIYVHICTR